MGLKPLSIAVLDAGWHLLAFQRQDRASKLRPQIACAKAAGALGLGVSSRKIGDMAAERPTFIASLGPIAPHGWFQRRAASSSSMARVCRSARWG
ncbi:heme-binding protein [Sphingobium sp. TomTYG75]